MLKFLVFTHFMRRPCLRIQRWQDEVLHNNRAKFSKQYFRYCSIHEQYRRDVTSKPRPKYLPDTIYIYLFFEGIYPELGRNLLKSLQNRIFLKFIPNVFSSWRK